MNKNLKNVAVFASSGPFTESQLRWWIFNAQSNGLDAVGAVVRIGKRVYIDADAFERWISLQNPPTSGGLVKPTPTPAPAPRDDLQSALEDIRNYAVSCKLSAKDVVNVFAVGCAAVNALAEAHERNAPFVPKRTK